MFALFNPPGRKKKSGKSSKKSAKRSRKLAAKPKATAHKRKIGAYARFVGQYMKAHKGSTLAQAAGAWKSGAGKIAAHKKARQATRKGMGYKYIPRAAVPGIVASAVKGSVCNMDALRRARAKYCRMGAPTGIASMERHVGPTVDRLHSAAELGYRAVANNRKGANMRHRKGHRRKGFGFGPVRFNMGEMMAMNPPEATGVLAGFKPANITGVVPIMAGYVANAMVTKFLAGKIPMTKAGIGNYVLGLGSAGLIGALAGSIDKNVGKGMFIGAVVEPIGRAVSDVASKGVGALSLSGVGWDNPNVADFDEGIAGLEDFTTPTAIAKALPTESTMSQYSLPAATAQAVRQEANVLREIITDDEMAMAM